MEDMGKINIVNSPEGEQSFKMKAYPIFMK